MSEDYEFQFEDIEDISSSSDVLDKKTTNSDTDGFEENGETQLDLNSFSSASVTEKADKNRKKKQGKRRILKVLLTVFLVGVITVSLVAGAFVLWVIGMQDDINEEMEQYQLTDLNLNFTTTIYVDNGKGDYDEYKRLHGTYNRIWVDYNEDEAKSEAEGYTGIPQQLVDAFVAIEDKRFATHSGTDWRRTFSAFVNMVLPGGESYGGSTITQQLVKNLTFDDERKASRKVREILRARYFEEHYSKEVIVESYLNVIALGHGRCGVQTAANYYFNKDVNELDLVECATLAAITQSPLYLAPDTNPEANKKRRDTVLYQMYDQKYITKEEYENAVKQETVLNIDEDSAKNSEINSYFVDALIDQVVADLMKEYGYDKSYAEQLFYTGGYRIYATVDPNIQSAMETVYKDSKTYALKAKNGALMQGAMTIMDYSGNVKGIVGGIGEKTKNRELNRATQAIRQPGSTIKPLSAYALAIEKNEITYSTKLNDTATNYNGWKPVNWYGSYWGSITTEYALERSVNTIPVYLVNKLTPQVSYDFLTQKVGITTLNKNDINLSPMGMGGTNGGFTTLESTAAFAIFGNGGYYYEPKMYTKVLDQKNDVVLSKKEKGTRVITSDTATIMNKLLQNVVYGANGTGNDAASSVPQMKMYAKTGTTNDQKDLWFVGGSPYYVGASWCGYDKQQDISSSSIALRMWTAVMSKVHNNLPAKEFPESQYVVDRYFCTQTGSLATDACPQKKVGWYKKSNQPGVCTAHGGNALATPSEIAKAEEEAKKEAEKENEKAENNNSSSNETTSSQ